ncbi:MAG: sarcosine oxidase subunit gamma [Pseudomonadota bacterium]|nr:sarcosine oxidase subunit gamma [Pseudomonadota bacterium]
MTPNAVRRSVLDGRPLPASGRVKVYPSPFATRLNLRGGADVVEPVARAFGVAPPTRPMGSASAGERAALWLGPDEWLLLAEENAGDLMGQLTGALGGVFHGLVDVSHRQVGLVVEGPGAARLLAAGCPLDLDLRAFPVGLSTRTLLVKAEIGLWRREENAFRIEVLRSFAPYVARILDQAARDQG